MYVNNDVQLGSKLVLRTIVFNNAGHVFSEGQVFYIVATVRSFWLGLSDTPDGKIVLIVSKQSCQTYFDIVD